MSLGFEIFTLFPEAVAGFLQAGLMGKAITAGHISVHTTNFREFASDRHRTVDDTPYGGGAGMLLKPGPVVAALEHAVAARGPMHTVMLTPAAPTFDQRAARRLATLPRIGILCGRYEGFDDRVRDCVDECLSIGDFVLNGGEVAALVLVEAIARLRQGVLGNPESIAHESFAETGGDDRWLEPPHFTRPVVFRGLEVPKVLQGGNHRAIARYRQVEAWRRTWALRPQLRPRLRLCDEQPLYCLAPGELADTIKSHGLEPLSGPIDAKRVRKQLTRRHGCAPRWVGLGLGGGNPTAASVPASANPKQVLDLLAVTGALSEQTPIVLVLDQVIASPKTDEGILTNAAQPQPDAHQRRWPAPVEAVIQMSADAHQIPGRELAQRSQIYESSQPRVPGEWIDQVLSRVLSTLRQP